MKVEINSKADPGFASFVERSGLPFRSNDYFHMTDEDSREALWNRDDLLADAD